MARSNGQDNIQVLVGMALPATTVRVGSARIKINALFEDKTRRVLGISDGADDETELTRLEAQRIVYVTPVALSPSAESEDRLRLIR